MNDTQQTEVQETQPQIEISTNVELQDYNNQVLSYLQNINTSTTLYSFFFGALLGVLVISLFWKRIRT